jgi:hypothetical protein
MKKELNFTATECNIIKKTYQDAQSYIETLEKESEKVN